MIRKAMVILGAIVVMGLLFGCEKNSTNHSDKDTNQNQEIVDNNPANSDQNQSEEAVTDTEEKPTDTDQQSEVPEKEIKVFFANEDATGFTEEVIQIEGLSKEQVFNALVEKGVVIPEVKVQSIEQSEKNGEQVLDLDFSTEFEEYINSMGTTGEYLTLGSICNTFLDAYECEKIKITINGEDLVTGHAEYLEYMGKFN